MNPWDADETRSAIERTYGREQLRLARPCIRSLSDREFYARFHYQRAQRTLMRYVRTHLGSRDFIRISLGVDEDDWNRFNIVIRKLSADLVACIQSLHAIPDILASAVYFSLQLNTCFQPKAGRYVNHAFVTKCLQEIKGYETVQEHLKAATAGEAAKHLGALVNQAKHYSIVFPALNADLTGKRTKQYMLAFPEFKSGKKTYPQFFVNDFLPPVHAQLSRSVVSTGNALNQVLSGAA